MCIILFAYNCHPQYRLVVAANRDEFYNRPTLPAAFWDDNPNILAGRDLRENGTWMGISTTGRFAALTNYRDPANIKPQAPSRGHLVQDYLNSDLAPKPYLDQLADGGGAYNGFNLLLGTRESLFYYSNREKLMRKVTPGIHGMSNSLLDVPWPKVSRGITALANALQVENIAAHDLFNIMTNQEQPADQDLPQTGVNLELERMLAPIFVHSPNYGTRLTSVILVGHNHQVQFWERTYIDKHPNTWNEVSYEFIGPSII